MFFEVPLNRIGEMAEVTADAFISSNDSLGNFMFQNEKEHLVLKKRFYTSFVNSCSPNAVRHAISSDSSLSPLQAISIWFPPGMDHSQDLEIYPFDAQDFMSPDTMKKVKAVTEVIDALTRNLAKEPQWYLHLIAVSPQFFGYGYSSKLIRPILTKAENDGLPCSLITQNMGNVTKYQKFGFKIVKEVLVPDSFEKIYSMRKDKN